MTALDDVASHPCSCASALRANVCASTNASHERWSGPELMPIGSEPRARMNAWVQEYDRALTSGQPAVYKLSRSALTRSFVRDQ